MRSEDGNDIVGERYDNLEVVKCLGRSESDSKWKRQNKYLCLCHGCGGYTIVFRSQLISGQSRNCGCQMRGGRRKPPVTIAFCERCGEIYVRRSNSQKFCDDCSAVSKENVQYAGKSISRTSYEKRKTKVTMHTNGPLKGMSIAEINALARERHLSYGKFKALVEYLGEIPPVEDKKHE